MAEITTFKIEHRLDTTVTINGDTWVKPGVNAGMTFNGLPTSEQIKMASEYMTQEILDPLATELVENVAQKLREAGVPPQF